MNKIFPDIKRISTKGLYCSINIKGSIDPYGNDKI